MFVCRRHHDSSGRARTRLTSLIRINGTCIHPFVPSFFRKPKISPVSSIEDGTMALSLYPQWRILDLLNMWRHPSFAL